MNQVQLPKSKLAKFISFLGVDQQVIGPVPLGEGHCKLAAVSSLAEMCLDSLPPILPPKKYYLPQHETLLEYDTANGQQMQALVEVERLVLFGVRSCDLAAIQCLDLAFSDPPCDEHYLLRKDYLCLIGLGCKVRCDRFANCGLLDTFLPKGGYDLFFSELTDAYHVDVQTLRGNELVEQSGLFEKFSHDSEVEYQVERRLVMERFKSELPLSYRELPELFDQTFDSPVWEELGRRCLACGNCTNVCPTCYCFDVVDEADLQPTRGRRLRVWDSCQHEDFAKVAGGESFRPTRRERQRHRFFHKFKYLVERYRRSFCTGCGRCSRSCMAQIELQETLGALLKERE